MTILTEIAQRFAAAFLEAQRQGVLPEGELPESPIDRPQNPNHGDFASSLPLRLSKLARKAPMQIGESLVPFVLPGGKPDGVIDSVWVAPPGFLNVKLSDAWLQAQVESIREAGVTFGNTSFGVGKSVQLEFVSVNPTGPVHVGHARGAVLGSSLANALEAAGFDVAREYYVNDAGTQMELFYESTYVRYAQALGETDGQIPENGYQGQYLIEVGEALANEHGRAFLGMERSAGVAAIGAVGLDRMLANIEADLMGIGVNFDVWFREKSLFESGEFDESIAILDKAGYTAERDGARWFTSTALGEEKDNVIVRSSGSPTYFASDIAYHRNKLIRRGFDHVIDIWGADHQGHVTRMKAVLRALGIDDSRLTILISQLVTLKSGGDIVRASKRTGQIITLADLVEEVGSDACRFFFLSRAAESQMEFDLELAKKESSDNPVYYVQYAHARISGILRQAAERSVSWADGDLSLLTNDAELALVRKMLVLPEHIDSIAVTLAPHALPHYAVELANAFHQFYDQCRVISSEPDDIPIMKARLKLVEAARIVLARTLTLMGMSTPDTM
jgi:arginyl-tRNA synthetase